MMYKTNILAVSVIAMLAVVQVASAEIASRGYVDAQIQSVNTAMEGKQDVSNMLNATSGAALGNLKNNIAGENNITTQYPSVATVGALINESKNDIGGDYQRKSSAAYSMGNAAGGWSAMTEGQQNALNSGATTTKINKIGTTAITAKGADGTTAATDLSAAVNAIDSRVAANKSAIDGINDSTDPDSLISRISAAEGDISQATGDISTLNSGKQAKSAADYQVGNSEGGWTTLSSNQIAALNSGATGTLINKITANETAIGVLNGDDQTTGSVAKQIADALNDANASNAVQSVTANNNAGVVTSIAKDGTAITMTKAKVTSAEIADNANIAKSQLASGVQTSLGYADAYNTASASYGDILTHNAAEFATAAQGNAADSAIQGVQVNGSDLTPTNGVVNVTVPTGTLAGLDAVGSAQITDGSVMLTDLASGVQTSLGYADAYHAAAGTYITVPGAEGTDGKSVLTYDADTQTYYWEEIGR